MHTEFCLRFGALKSVLCASIVASIAMPHSSHAAEGDFSDVPASHYAYSAVVYLRQQGILGGYADGTFQPERKVNRAEALKIITAALIPDNEKNALKTSSFTDVPEGAWYIPYVEWAAKKKIIDGPPAKKTFSPTRNVTKAEFIKMFIVSRNIDPNSFGDIAIPLSSDIRDPKEWYYPHLRYAIASSMTVATKNALFSPHRDLTRADVALLLHRYFLYRAGQRTQDILTETQTEIERVLTALERGDSTGADYASARAVLMIRGAREIRPNEPMVKVVVKIAEGYRALVRAYRAGDKRDWNGVVKHAQDAYYLGEQAKEITPNAATLAAQLQKYASTLASQARSQL
jgi:hypothetical protein